MPLRVMSFNIRYSGAKDGVNAWVYRRSAVIELVKKYHPDIVGFQETMVDQYFDLKQGLTDYQILGGGEDYLPRQLERLPIFYLPQNLTLDPKAQGVFWMGKTPDIPTNHWWGEHPRICVWGHFQDKHENRTVAVYHTHYDHIWEYNRKRMARLTLERMRNQSPNIPHIMFGDLNTSPESPTHQIIAAELHDIYADGPNARSPTSVSFHDYTGRTTVSGKKGLNEWVDYIWVSREIIPIKTKILIDRPEPGTTSAQYITDHWILLADLGFSK